jgi:hypothetical protein
MGILLLIKEWTLGDFVRAYGHFCDTAIEAENRKYFGF